MSPPSDRALAIARGLVLSGEARLRDRHGGGFVRLIATEIGPGGCAHFWVANDGSQIIKQWPDHRDAVLPQSFADALARAGESPAGRAIELKPGPTPSPAEDPWLYDEWDPPYRPPGWKNPISLEPLPEHIRARIAERQRERGE